MTRTQTAERYTHAHTVHNHLILLFKSVLTYNPSVCRSFRHTMKFLKSKTKKMVVRRHSSFKQPNPISSILKILILIVVPILVIIYNNIRVNLSLTDLINNNQNEQCHGGGGNDDNTSHESKRRKRNSKFKKTFDQKSDESREAHSLEAYTIMVSNDGDTLQRACELVKNIIDIDKNIHRKIIFMMNDPIIPYEEIKKHCNYDVINISGNKVRTATLLEDNEPHHHLLLGGRLILKQIPKFPIEFTQRFHAWEITFQRLRFFDPKIFPEYNDVSLVVLDVDLLIRKDISELFQILQGDAPGAFVWSSDDPFPNGGVWVMKPSTYIYERLVQKAQQLKLSDKATIGRVNVGSEQTFLVYALDGILDKFIELPSNYNLILSGCNQLGLNRLERVKVVHSTCGPKFWSRYDNLDPNDNSCEAKFTREWKKSRF